jgi:5-(carboxyamino)imidazole ribonucleotide synthase
VADQTLAIGVLGGGQLGLMLAESIDRLGRDTAFIEPDEDAPCSTRRGNVIVKRADDPAGLAELFARVEVATYDSENIARAPLLPYAARLVPSLKVLEVSQDRAKEKTFLKENGFHPVQFAFVPPEESLADAARTFGFPCIAKSVLGGYDGKGQFKLEGEADLAGFAHQAAGGWVLEEVLQLRVELSCIVARDGVQAFTFPVFENLHRHHILDFTVLPARVPDALQEEARFIALGVAEALEVRGLLTVELFLGTGRDGVERLYVNELAPRVHNSGHVTRQACTVSQFDALARILCGVPLNQPRLHSGGWCMGQLLGDVWLAQGRDGGALDLSAWRDFPDVVDVYVYGKRHARTNRKMGHFIVRADSADAAVARAGEFREALISGDRK